MKKVGILVFLLAIASGIAIPATAQAPAKTGVSTAGTLVIVPAFGEVTRPNDEAHATFMIEEQNQDKAVAASRVNSKMKQGAAIIRRVDPRATLKTRGYYTYPVYADEAVPVSGNKQARTLLGWRVGQYLEMATTNLDGLAKTVADAQNVLALNSLQFGLANATQKTLEQQRMEATYHNLLERIDSIARAMGRDPSDAVIDTIDFEGSGAYAPAGPAPKMMRMTTAAEAAPVEEPSFEPGETTLNMRLVGKVKFK